MTEFMDLMREWIILHEQGNDRELIRSEDGKHRDWERKVLIEDEINARMRGELPRL